MPRSTVRHLPSAVCLSLACLAALTASGAHAGERAAPAPLAPVLRLAQVDPPAAAQAGTGALAGTTAAGGAAGDSGDTAPRSQLSLNPDAPDPMPSASALSAGPALGPARRPAAGPSLSGAQGPQLTNASLTTSATPSLSGTAPASALPTDAASSGIGAPGGQDAAQAMSGNASGVAGAAVPSAMPASASDTPADGSFNGTAGRMGAAVATDEVTERNRMQLEAGIRYENGEGGLPRDFMKARNLYCDAARDNYPDAMVRLGWLYANGRGVARNDAIAATLFERAARLGSDMANQLLQLFRSTAVVLPGCMTGGGPDPQATDTASAGAALPTPVVAAPALFRTEPPALERRKVVEMVMHLARTMKLDPRLVLALISTESGFDPNAKSPRNAQGLMQLIPDTAERFAVKDILDPMENLRGGMTYLRWLLSYYRGDVMLAVAAYNAGEGAVDKFHGVPPYPETLAYVQRIRAFYPFDFHPFDPSVAANGPSSIVRVSADADGSGKPAPVAARPRS